MSSITKTHTGQDGVGSRIKTEGSDVWKGLSFGDEHIRGGGGGIERGRSLWRKRAWRGRAMIVPMAKHQGRVYYNGNAHERLQIIQEFHQEC